MPSYTVGQFVSLLFQISFLVAMHANFVSVSFRKVTELEFDEMSSKSLLQAIIISYYLLLFRLCTLSYPYSKFLLP